MNQVKLEDLRCGHCKKIPTPGDKIYSCSLCPRNRRYRCEACISPSLFHRLEPHHHGLNFFQSPSFSTMRFEPILTKLVLENFTPRREYFCSSSKNGCLEKFTREEFLVQKAHEKSCIYQDVPCPSVDCNEDIALKDVDNHMEKRHRMLKVEKMWNFQGIGKDLDEIICCLSSYDQKFFPQAFVKENQFHFKVIMLNHQVNAIPFDVNMTFFLEDGKNFSMKNRVYPVSENDKTNNFLKFPLKQITEYFDSKSMELKRQPKIDFCLKIVNEKMDEIAKEKNQNVESGNL